MNDTGFSALNRAFGIDGKLTFAAGPGGLCTATLKSPHSEIRVALAGAHVMHFQPHGEAPVLWMSRQSYFEEGKPIRGGIPVCWPWFGPHPSDPSRPQHGFARLMTWSVLETAERPDKTLLLRLGLDSNEATLRIWPHAFHLDMRILAGRELIASLSTDNTGPDEIRLTMALHSYFHVGDVRQIAITGLENNAYSDKEDGAEKQQDGPIQIHSETDRVYSRTTSDCVIHTPGLNRRIRISKEGSRSTVVWNPWIDKAARMPDFGDDEYTGMVCVETANTAGDKITLPAGKRHTITACLRTEPLRPPS